MRTFAVLLILVAIASSQPYQWLIMVGQALVSIAHYLGS